MSRFRMKWSALALAAAAACTPKAPEPYGALPTASQIQWQRMETNMFVHFGPNTFTNSEWGDGMESADVFSPSDLDCRQWAATAKAAGMKGIIITAKHHDGFCLWPNPASRHTVAQSSWMDGKGDVLRELSDACSEYGLKFGIYISPWDRNDPHYGTDGYNDVFCETLESALGSYGPVFEQWFDGACGEGPSGKKQVYDWPAFNSTVFRMQPDAVIFSNVGPGCRWVGNEEGSAGRTCWGTMNIGGLTPSSPADCDKLNEGEPGGEKWVAAETDVSIRPGWFWRESENSRVKTLDELLKIYYESVGRNSLLLLNVPADTRGHLHETDSVRLMEFRGALDEIFACDLAAGASVEASSVRGGSRKFAASNLLNDDYDSFWAVDDDVIDPSVTLHLGSVRKFNRVVLQEYIPLGQRITGFTVEIPDADGNWKEIARETTVGYKRIVLLPETEADAVRISIAGALACPVLNRLALYHDGIYSGGKEEKPAALGVMKAAGEPLETDLGETAEISGFFYEPVYRGEGGSIVTYDLFVSTDGENWNPVFSDRMFANIVNNPVLQEVFFDEIISARFVRLVPRTTSADGAYGVSRFGALPAPSAECEK